MSRQWGIELPDSPYITPNSRAHWSKRKECAQVWRTASRLLAKQAKIPTLEHVCVSLDHWPKDRRRRDADGLSLVAKWCLDGIVDAGVIEDDSYGTVREMALRMHPPRPDRQPVWLFTVSEVAA